MHAYACTPACAFTIAPTCTHALLSQAKRKYQVVVDEKENLKSENKELQDKYALKCK